MTKQKTPPLPSPLECEYTCSICSRQIIDGRWKCWCREIHTLLIVFLISGGVVVLASVLFKVFL